MTDRAAARLDLVATTARWNALAFDAKSVTPRPWSIYEEYFYAALRTLLANEAERLVGDVISGGMHAAFDAAWWSAHRAALDTLLANSLEDLARFGVLAARRTLPSLAVPVNWNLVNTQAVAWAKENAGQLVTQLTETTRAGVNTAVGEWTASGEPLSGLVARIQALTDPVTGLAFSPKRAALIAQTESTNAFASGNARAWAAMGVAPAAYQPAAHPGCRCYMQPWKTPAGPFVVVWFTAHDERVCSQPLDTPWGEVAGCAALHLTVVSEGELMGSKRT